MENGDGVSGEALKSVAGIMLIWITWKSFQNVCKLVDLMGTVKTGNVTSNW